MKKKLTISVLAIFLKTICAAQQVFTAANLPLPGTVHRFREGTAINFPNASQGSSWSFLPQSFLTRDSSRVTYNNISTVSEAQYYPQANMVKERIDFQTNFGTISRDTLLYFYRSDASGLYFHGTCKPGETPPFPFVRENLEIPFPLSSGTVFQFRDTSDYYYMGSLDSTLQRTYLYERYEVLGSGSLSLAGNTHQVLPVKYTYSSTDSVFTYNPGNNPWNFNFTSSNGQDYFRFYSTDMGTSVLNGNFYNNEGQDDWQISYLLNSPGITSMAGAETAGPILYPNPGRGIFSIRNSSQSLFICNIFDAQGRLVSKQESPSLFFNNGNLPAGAYTVQLISADGKLSFTKRLMVEK